jgi:hypothetical protein
MATTRNVIAIVTSSRMPSATSRTSGALPLFKESAVSIDDDLRQVLDICNCDLKAALRMVLVVNAYYEEEIRRLKNEASTAAIRKQCTAA